MKFLLPLAIAATMLFAPGQQVNAQADEDVIRDFSAQYTLNNSKVGGYLKTSETIKVDFDGQNHGILRAIPLKRSGYDTKLQITKVQRDGKAENYTTSKENNNLVLKIGDANALISGEHTYKIEYTQQRVVSFADGKKEFYWDVNGTQWAQKADKVSATLTLEGGSFESRFAGCFTGAQGSTGKDCEISFNGSQVVFTTTKPLAPYENLTVAADVSSIAFAAPSLNDQIRDNLKNLIFLGLGLTASLVVFFQWYRFGKDPKGKGITVPEYEPPKNLTPAEIGMLADYRVDTRDLSATLIDLAVRRYIKIHENVSKVLFFTRKQYEIEIINVETKELKPFELSLLQGLFGTIIPGARMKLDNVDKRNMAKEVGEAKKEIKENLMNVHGVYEKKSQTLSTIFIAAGFVLIFGAFFTGFLGWGAIAGVSVLGASSLLAGFYMPKRSHAGLEMYEKIQGLKLYMNVAEKDRLKMMQSVNRPYAEPAKTVELFEKLLPFAVALGVEKSWAKQFEGILSENPGWLDSNSGAAFSGAYLASSISGVTSGFSGSIESSTSASSGGGGFSGGGGGGGGGGTW